MAEEPLQWRLNWEFDSNVIDFQPEGDILSEAPTEDYFDTHCIPDDPRPCVPFQRHIEKCGGCPAWWHQNLGCRCEFCDDYCANYNMRVNSPLPQGIGFEVTNIWGIPDSGIYSHIKSKIWQDFNFEHYFDPRPVWNNYYLQAFAEANAQTPWLGARFYLSNGATPWMNGQEFYVALDAFTYYDLDPPYYYWSAVSYWSATCTLPYSCRVLENGTKLAKIYNRIFINFVPLTVRARAYLQLGWLIGLDFTVEFRLFFIF